jgi:formate/nitrite transporter FocA (FNT family)
MHEADREKIACTILAIIAGIFLALFVMGITRIIKH